MRYEIAVTGMPNATVNINTLNLRLAQTRQRVRENDLVLSRFLTKQKLGWATLGLTAAAALKSVSKGSTLLTMALQAPATLLQALGTAIDVAFPGALANLAAWLAKTQGDIINWGNQLGQAQDKVGFLAESLGRLAATPFKVTIDFIKNIIENPVQAAAEAAKTVVDIATAPGKAVKGFLEEVGVPSPASDVLGYGANIGILKWLEKSIPGFVEDVVAKRIPALAPELLTAGGAATRTVAGGLGAGAGAAANVLAGPLGWLTAILDIGSQRAGGGGWTPMGYPGTADFEANWYDYVMDRMRGQGDYQQEGMGVGRQAMNVVINNYFATHPEDPGSLNWSQVQQQASLS